MYFLNTKIGRNLFSLKIINIISDKSWFNIILFWKNEKQ